MNKLKALLISTGYICFFLVASVLIAVGVQFVFPKNIGLSGNATKYVIEIVSYSAAAALLFLITENKKSVIRGEMKKPRKGLVGLLLVLGISRCAATLFMLDKLSPLIGSTAASEQISTADLPLLFLSVGIAAPIAEEFAFRAVAYSRLRTAFGSVSAIIICGAMFGVLHISSIANIVSAFTGGIILCWIYERCGTFLASALVHAAFNTTNIFTEYVMKIEDISAPVGLISIAVFAAATVGVYFVTKNCEHCGY